MRTTLIGAMAALTSMSAPSPAMARAVDYNVPTATLIAGGEELKIAPLTTELHPRTHVENVSSAVAADHTTLALGIYCAAFKVENPISQLMEATKSEWNKASESSTKSGRFTPISLTINSASSYRRCVEVSEMNVRCITKVKVAGTVTVATTDSQRSPIPISGEAERDSSVGGFCANLAKGIGVVSREAVIALLLDAESKLPPAPTATATVP